MNIGISFHKPSGEFCANATIGATTLEGFDQEMSCDPKEEWAVGVILDDYEPQNSRGHAALDSLVRINSGPGTFCNAFEEVVSKTYQQGDANGYKRGKEEAMADLEKIVETVVAKITARSTQLS